MSIGTKLRDMLVHNKLTQTELAKKLGISLSTLNGYMTDYREPDAKMLFRLAEELHTTVDFLLNEEPLPQTKNGPYRTRVKVIAHNEGVELTKEQEDAVTRYMKFLLSEDDGL